MLHQLLVLGPSSDNLVKIDRSRFSWLRNLMNQEELNGCHWASIAVRNPYALVHGLSGSRMMKLSYDCTA